MSQGKERSEPQGFVFPARLHYNVTAGFALSNHLLQLKSAIFVGQRCSQCRNVYMPPLGACSICALPTEEEVVLPPIGTIQTFCIVNIPVRGQGIDLPFACADIQLDGANTTFLALIQECAVEEVHIGMRVECVWREDRNLSLASVAYFRPLRSEGIETVEEDGA